MTDDPRSAARRPSQRRFSVEHWAAFWARPHPELASQVVAPDVVGYWPGLQGPARGVTEYKRRIAQILDQVPDLRLEVAAHATRDEVVMIRWTGGGTGSAGRFELDGVDYIRLRDGLIRETRFYYDPERFDPLRRSHSFAAIRKSG